MCWIIDRFLTFRPKGRRFESHSSHYVGTLGKSSTRSCCALRRDTPTQYPCCIRSASE